jgi:hypothetical protein
VTDQDNDAITQYSVYDTGTGGGHFVINGQAVAAGQWVNAGSLSAIDYVAGPSPGSEILYFSASDGPSWANATTAAVTTTLSGVAEVELLHQHDWLI